VGLEPLAGGHGPTRRDSAIGGQEGEAWIGLRSDISSHSAEKLAILLKEHGIEVVVNTRSRQRLQYAPRFNAHTIEAFLLERWDRLPVPRQGNWAGGRGEFYDARGARVDYALVGVPAIPRWYK